MSVIGRYARHKARNRFFRPYTQRGMANLFVSRSPFFVFCQAPFGRVSVAVAKSITSPQFYKKLCFLEKIVPSVCGYGKYLYLYAINCARKKQITILCPK